MSSFSSNICWAKKSGAHVVCGDRLFEDFTRQGMEAIHPLSVGGKVELKELNVSGIRVQHGPLPVKMLGGLLSVTGKIFRVMYHK